MPSELLTERRDHTLVLTMSGPASRNALSAQLFAAGIEAVGVAESDPDLRCLVLQGAGGHFSAGRDIAALRERRTDDLAARVQMVEHFHQFVEALRSCPKPVIAAVEGEATGSGFSLALACDLVVAAEDARFALSQSRLGLPPDGGASWHLVRALARPRALQAIWLGDALGARELLRMGLVAQVCDSGKALAEACALAERLARLAPNALAAGKDLVAHASGHSLGQQLSAERNQFMEALVHPNAGEGLQAFAEQRPPRFR